MRTHATGTVRAPSIEQTTWRIDPDRSSVGFHVKTVWGFASLDTRNKMRDKHLRSPDFFGVEQHPYIRFVSESVALEGERLKVRGHLHARGASIPLDIDAMLRRAGHELEIEAVAGADHHEFGMTWNPMAMLRTPSKLIVKGRLTRAA